MVSVPGKFPDTAYSKILTSRKFDETSDDKLMQLVIESLRSTLVNENFNERKFFQGWSKPQQTIYLIWLLESEANEGGFNQFYLNPSGRFYELVPDALRRIGSKKFADLTEMANYVFKLHNDSIGRDAEGRLKGFSKSYDRNLMNQFDNEFYNLYNKEVLKRLEVGYIRRNKYAFVSD